MAEIKTNWTPDIVDLQADFPKKLEITSSFLFENNDGREDFFHICGNIFGVLGGYPRRLDIFDAEQGKVLWTAKPYADMLGGRALYDNGVLYIGYEATNTAASIKAHKIETGEVIWERKLTNSDEQFGTRMVQTSSRIVAPNVKKDTLFIIDKQTGKQTAKLPMTNQFEGGRGTFLRDDVVFTFNDKLYILAYKKNYVIDCYNPEIGEFERTLFELPKSDSKQRIQAISQIDGDLCFFMESGVFYRISLTDGKVKAEIMLGKKEKPDDYFRCLAGFLHHQNKLSIIARNSKDIDTLHIYNLETDKLEESITIPQLNEDYSIAAPTPYTNTVLRYGYGEPSKNGLSLYDFDKNETISELILPQYSEEEVDWRSKHIIAGNAIYLIQRIDSDAIKNACVLHRIQ